MLKKIQFKLVRIKYTGKSIGDDIRVDVEILGNTISVDEKIIINKTVEINKEIGSFLSDQKSLATKVKITVVEKDVLFNDVGNIEESIKIDANISNPQKFAFTIELQENRFWKNWGKSVAKFEVTLEALVMESIKYIPDVSNGWLKVNLVDGESISLPAYLKVQSEYFERNREYFTILEGYYKNKKASVSLDNGNSRLVVDIKHEPLVHLKYSISKKVLIIDNKKYQATDDVESPWEKGWYDIEMPDYPHKDYRNYVKISSRFKTWFRIGHGGERYLHTGRTSLGCITITDIEKWNEIYNKLVKARKGDFISVGVLEVIT